MLDLEKRKYETILTWINYLSVTKATIVSIVVAPIIYVEKIAQTDQLGKFESANRIKYLMVGFLLIIIE